MSALLNSSIARYVGAILLAFCLALMAACGSTKVYTADKTVIYRDSIYNVSNVQRISARQEAKTPDGQDVDLANKNKNQLKAFFKDNPDSVVTMAVDMDTQEMVYLRTKVDGYSEYARLDSRFEKAMKDITKFMADKKKTQLKLK